MSAAAMMRVAAGEGVEHDCGAPPAAMADAVPGAALRVVPDAAHVANPAGFAEAVDAFPGLQRRA